MTLPEGMKATSHKPLLRDLDGKTLHLDVYGIVYCRRLDTKARAAYKRLKTRRDKAVDAFKDWEKEHRIEPRSMVAKAIEEEVEGE